MQNETTGARALPNPKFKTMAPPLLAAGLLAGVAANPARADDTVPAPVAPPAHTALRYDEDYSYLNDSAVRTNVVDQLKFIPLDKAGNAYLTLGGEARDRYEYFNNYLFGRGAQTADGYNLLRVMLDADLHLSPYLRVFTEGISATEQGRDGGPRPSDVNNIDLFQAFADIIVPLGTDSSFTVRGGRQVMVFGAQRLVGVSDFTNVRRSFDGVRATLATPGNKLDFFYARPVQVLPYEFDNDVPATYLTGVYDTWQLPGFLATANSTLETYALLDGRRSITFNETTGSERRYTFGSRFATNPKPWDYDLEADYQYGTFNGQSGQAFSIATIGGYTLESVQFEPRAFLGFDIASGGNRNNPGETFDQLFPSGHDQFGTIDALGRQNIIDVHPGFTLNLVKDEPAAKRLSLLVQYRQFWRENDQDAAYTSSGTILRTSGGSNATGIGGEVDTQVNWQLNHYISAYAGYAHFFHGEFITETGPANDIDFAYTALTLTF